MPKYLLQVSYTVDGIKGVRKDIKGRVDEAMKRTWVADMANRQVLPLASGPRADLTTRSRAAHQRPA